MLNSLINLLSRNLKSSYSLIYILFILDSYLVPYLITDLN